MPDEHSEEHRIFEGLQQVLRIEFEDDHHVRTVDELNGRLDDLHQLVGGPPAAGLASWSLFTDEWEGCFAPFLSAVDPLDEQELAALLDSSPLERPEALLRESDVAALSVLPIGVDNGGAFVVANPINRDHGLARVAHVDWIAQFFAVADPALGSRHAVESHDGLPTLLEYIDAVIHAHLDDRFDRTASRELKSDNASWKAAFPWPA